MNEFRVLFDGVEEQRGLGFAVGIDLSPEMIGVVFDEVSVLDQGEVAVVIAVLEDDVEFTVYHSSWHLQSRV